MHEIPGVSSQFSLHLGQKTGRAEEMEHLLPPEEYPQQAVKADEMVHMGVRDKHMGDFEEIPGLEPVEFPQVEQECPSFEPEGDIQSGIGKRVVYESRYEGSMHI